MTIGTQGRFFSRWGSRISLRHLMSKMPLMTEYLLVLLIEDSSLMWVLWVFALIEIIVPRHWISSWGIWRILKRMMETCSKKWPNFLLSAISGTYFLSKVDISIPTLVNVEIFMMCFSRDYKSLSGYKDTASARAITMAELKRIIQANPIFQDKLRFPEMRHQRLRRLINQGYYSNVIWMWPLKVEFQL